MWLLAELEPRAINLQLPFGSDNAMPHFQAALKAHISHPTSDISSKWAAGRSGSWAVVWLAGRGRCSLQPPAIEFSCTTSWRASCPRHCRNWTRICTVWRRRVHWGVSCGRQSNSPSSRSPRDWRSWPEMQCISRSVCLRSWSWRGLFTPSWMNYSKRTLWWPVLRAPLCHRFIVRG